LCWVSKGWKFLKLNVWLLISHTLQQFLQLFSEMWNLTTLLYADSEHNKTRQCFDSSCSILSCSSDKEK
jgi:hypothetical protein